MKFKRLRTYKGTTTLVELPNNDIRRCIRCNVTNGNGVPIARFMTQINEDKLVCTLNPEVTMSLSGHYKYEIVVENDKGVQVLQYGILEVM
ncbi:hypothetical protein [Vibrio sp. ER1A]|uniref:hypothetical protein n=1 Tax=Vibrio sp. ER1A TaxID=1517681 RepID=UPI0004DCB6DF|nr:hypothetical protein [Vibrio sp. ER1A]KFA97566.1 hypothetical protein HW45_09160 [Vibrio sp. ER1A]